MAFVHMRLEDNLGRIRMWVNIWGGRPPLFSFKDVSCECVTIAQFAIMATAAVSQE